MSEALPERKKVISIESALVIQKKERSREEHAIMRELERLIPLLFTAENELIVARNHVRDANLRRGIPDNAPHIAELPEDDVVQERVEYLIDEVAYIKAQMYELMERVTAVDEEKRKLLDREAQLKDLRSGDK